MTASLFFALVLTVVDLPVWLETLRPAWVTLGVIYWCIAFPQWFGVASAWTAGLLLDVLLRSTLGMHGLGIATVAFFTIKLHQRLRIAPLLQQTVSVAVLVCTEYLIRLWVLGATGQPIPDLSYWLPVFSSALLWPLWRDFLMRVQHEFKLR